MSPYIKSTESSNKWLNAASQAPRQTRKSLTQN
jgi:hypothetical protein